MDRRKGTPFPDNTIIPKLVLQTKEGEDLDITEFPQLVELESTGHQPNVSEWIFLLFVNCKLNIFPDLS